MIRKSNLRWVALVGTTALLFVVPLIATDRFVFTVIQMLVASLFALAFNLLWRHARLLSFGHATYFGVGMFATIHLMRAAESGALLVPLPLLPLTGLAAGLVIGAATGYFATIRTGTYFAMITLAFAELLYALGPQFDTVFGGEAGLSTMRMPWAFWTFGSIGQVYYVIAAWAVPAICSLYFFGLTPLGRIAFALGDDETRVRFLGYNVHATKTMVFTVSAAYSGLAGGLLALASENANYLSFGGAVSSSVVLQTFIGGSGVFLGPVIGAAGLTFLGTLLADATRLWLLYQGIIFIAVMVFVPEGIAPLVIARWQYWRLTGGRAGIARDATVATGLLLIASSIVFIAEFTASIMTGAKSNGVVRLFGLSWSLRSPQTWLALAFLIGAGIWLLRVSRHWEGTRSNQTSISTVEGAP